MQYHFGVNCIGYSLMLRNICPHIKKKFLIDTHTKIGTEITDVIIFRKKLLKFLQGVIRQDCSQKWHENERNWMGSDLYCHFSSIPEGWLWYSQISNTAHVETHFLLENLGISEPILGILENFHGRLNSPPTQNINMPYYFGTNWWIQRVVSTLQEHQSFRTKTEESRDSYMFL